MGAAAWPSQRCATTSVTHTFAEYLFVENNFIRREQRDRRAPAFACPISAGEGWFPATLLPRLAVSRCALFTGSSPFPQTLLQLWSVHHRARLRSRASLRGDVAPMQPRLLGGAARVPRLVLLAEGLQTAGGHHFFRVAKGVVSTRHAKTAAHCRVFWYYVFGVGTGFCEGP